MLIDITNDIAETAYNALIDVRRYLNNQLQDCPYPDEQIIIEYRLNKINEALRIFDELSKEA